MLDFIKSLITSFASSGTDMRFAVVGFSTNAAVEFYFDSYDKIDDIIYNIDTLKYHGGRTDIADGFQITYHEIIGKRGDRLHARNIVILITDGKPNERIFDTEPEASKVKQTGARVFTVGVTDEVDQDLLRKLASNENDFISSPDFASLAGIVKEIIGAACPFTTVTTILTPTPSPTVSQTSPWATFGRCLHNT